MTINKQPLNFSMHVFTVPNTKDAKIGQGNRCWRPFLANQKEKNPKNWAEDSPYFLNYSVTNVSLPVVCMPQIAIQGEYIKHAGTMQSDSLVPMPGLPQRNAI